MQIFYFNFYNNYFLILIFFVAYKLNEEALQYIASIPQPLGIIGVAGMYRTGKSYLLNRMLLDRSDGFGVGPTV